jgi:hypothetical protein
MIGHRHTVLALVFILIANMGAAEAARFSHVRNLRAKPTISQSVHSQGLRSSAKRSALLKRTRAGNARVGAVVMLGFASLMTGLTLWKGVEFAVRKPDPPPRMSFKQALRSFSEWTPYTPRDKKSEAGMIAIYGGLISYASWMGVGAFMSEVKDDDDKNL